MTKGTYKPPAEESLQSGETLPGATSGGFPVSLKLIIGWDEEIIDASLLPSLPSWM